MAAINCAIEESSVGDRACNRLIDHDIFIRDNIRSQDILIASLGGNDIALKPTICTICSILSLLCCTTTSCISNTSCGTALPCDDCCCGGTTGCLSNCLAFPFGLGYFIHLFKTRIQSILERITSKTKPRFVMICMIYYLDEVSGGSWADGALSALQYNNNPKKLQCVITKIFELATKEIRIPGTTVIAVPLFEVLNGKDREDYMERVEPSAKGGKKIGQFLVEHILSAIHAEIGNVSDISEDKRSSVTMKHI